MITPIYLDSPCYCSERRHWPSQDSLASCNPRLPFVFIQVFYDLFFDNQTFARIVVIRYVILLIFAMDVYRLPQIYMKHRGCFIKTFLCQYVLCRRPKTWPLFRSEELLLVHFGLFVCPPWYFMSYCRFWMYYPGMYYIFCCFESVTVGLTYIDVTALS